MRYINFHSHTIPEDITETTVIISCVAPEPLQECVDGMWLSYGVHPWYTHGHDIKMLLKSVEKAAADDRVLAIGEAGIDKVRGPAPGLQEEIFCQQVGISEKVKKPLIIHSVKSNNEILRLRKNMSPLQPWILHGYSGNPQEMGQLIDAGFYLSFGPKIFYLNKKVSESLKEMPADRFFLETDHTNKTITSLYLKAAEIRGISEEELKEIIDRNFKTIFE